MREEPGRHGMRTKDGGSGRQGLRPAGAGGRGERGGDAASAASAASPGGARSGLGAKLGAAAATARDWEARNRPLLLALRRRAVRLTAAARRRRATLPTAARGGMRLRWRRLRRRKLGAGAGG
jgi:hypothetical protein